MIEYDKFQKEWRALACAGVGFLGLVVVLSGLSAHSTNIVVVGFLTISASTFVRSFRHYLRIDSDRRTYETMKGSIWFQKPLKGSLDSISSVEVGRDISIGKYSSTYYFTVTMCWKDPVGHRFRIHEGQDFQEAARIAKELGVKTGVTVTESVDLKEFRNNYKHAAYEDDE